MQLAVKKLSNGCEHGHRSVRKFGSVRRRLKDTSKQRNS